MVWESAFFSKLGRIHINLTTLMTQDSLYLSFYACVGKRQLLKGMCVCVCDQCLAHQCGEGVGSGVCFSSGDSCHLVIIQVGWRQIDGSGLKIHQFVYIF